MRRTFKDRSVMPKLIVGAILSLFGLFAVLQSSLARHAAPVGGSPHVGGYGHRAEANRTPFRRFRTPRRRAGKVSDMISESLSDINRNRCPI